MTRSNTTLPHKRSVPGALCLSPRPSPGHAAFAEGWCTAGRGWGRLDDVGERLGAVQARLAERSREVATGSTRLASSRVEVGVRVGEHRAKGEQGAGELG